MNKKKSRGKEEKEKYGKRRRRNVKKKYQARLFSGHGFPFTNSREKRRKQR